MKTKHILFSAIMAVATSFVMIACNKSTSAEANATNSTQQFNMYLTDGPGLFDHVYIDIRSVKVLVDTSANTHKHDGMNWDRRGANDQLNDSSLVWQNLNITAGVYDILQFRNGADTLFASSSIPKGAIRLIKVEIGTNNSVVKDSVTYPVAIPADSLNYVLIKLAGNECDNYLPGKSRLWLDFDVARSIIVDINGKFYIRPVFHFFTLSTTASLSGRVVPSAAFPVVSVYNSTDTAYALPDRNGNFTLRGLKDGTYSVFINASNGYLSRTISNVTVTAPAQTSLGVITLNKQ
jgi:hypothetical protein